MAVDTKVCMSSVPDSARPKLYRLPACLSLQTSSGWATTTVSAAVLPICVGALIYAVPAACAEAITLLLPVLPSKGFQLITCETTLLQPQQLAEQSRARTAASQVLQPYRPYCCSIQSMSA